VLLGLNFWWLLVQLADGELLQESTQQIFGGLISFSMLVLVPLITMRLFAEERKLGTLEALLTTPLTSASLVLSKFFGALLFYMLLWSPVAVYLFILQRLAPEGVSGFPDFGAMRAGFFGVVLVGGFYLSVGIFMSSLTSNQIVAAISGFSLLSILFFSTLFMSYTAPSPAIQTLGYYFSPFAHLLDFSRGVVDSRMVVLYLSNMAWFLFATTLVIESKRT
jgi:ABC-2 type transport system permease protein